MTEPTTLPRSAVLALAVLATVGFLALLLASPLLPAKPAWQASPLLFVAALWLLPLSLALLRGERWAYVVALATLIFLTDASFRSRSWADKTLDWQVVLKGMAWAGCGLVGAVRLPRTLVMLGRPPMVFVLCFVLMLAASALWSPLPSYTLMSAIGFLFFLLFALAAAEVLDDRGVFQAIALGTGLIVLPSLAISPFAMGISATSPGSTGEVARLRGLTDHPIPLAESAALFILATLALWPRPTRTGGRLLLLLLAAAGLATTILTQSRIPLLATVAAAAGYVSYRRGGALLMVPVLVGFTMLVLILESVAGFARLLPADLMETVARSGSAKEILTLSGRLVIWPYVIEHIGDALLLGHGHASGMVVFKGFTPWKIVHAHNAFLQALLNVGLVGFTFLVLAVAWQLKAFLTRPEPARDILMLSLLLKGMTEQSMASNMPSAGVLLWMLTAAMASRAGALPLPVAEKGLPKAAPAGRLPRRASPP